MNRIVVFTFLLLSIGCATNNNQNNKAKEVVKSGESETIDLLKTTGEPYNIELQIGSLTDSAEFCEMTYRVADKMPYFPGGQKALAKHLIELYKLIDCAKGRLTKIGMIINKHGKVIGCMHKGFYGDCGDRLNAKIGEMSNWIPGYNDGKSVCVQVELDIDQLLNEIKQE